MPFCSPDKIIIPEGRFRTATVNDPAVIELANSIDQIGQLVPILVTKDMILVEGLHRLRACQRLNKEVRYEDAAEAGLDLGNLLQRQIAELLANIKRKNYSVFQRAVGVYEVDKMMREQRGSRTAGNQPITGSGEWTREETAKIFGFKSATTVNEEIKIAEAFKVNPAIKEAKTRKKALEMARDVERGLENQRDKKPSSIKTLLRKEKITSLFHQGRSYELQLFKYENDFEELICKNSKNIFGENNYYISEKSKIKTEFGDGTPDGFFLDVSDNNPILYCVEIEISTHGFDHINSQIINYNNLIRNNHGWRKILPLIAEFIPDEMQSLLNKCTQPTDCGVFIIIDKEDLKIEQLFDSQPKTLNKLKIISNAYVLSSENVMVVELRQA